MSRELSEEQLKALFSRLPDFRPSRGFEARVFKAAGLASRGAASSVLESAPLRAAVALTSAWMSAAFLLAFLLLPLYADSLLGMLLNPSSLIPTLKLLFLEVCRSVKLLPVLRDVASAFLPDMSWTAFAAYLAAALVLSLAAASFIPQTSQRRMK